MKYDFDNGRVLIPKILTDSSATVDAIYSVKDFNIYITDQTEEELLIETKFDKNSRFDQDIFDGIKPYDQVVPAIFISYEDGRNNPFAFGGEDTTQSNIRCVIFAENSYQLDGVFSILKDTLNTCIANVGYNEHPLNEFGDLKFGVYDYKDLSDRYYNLHNSQSSFYIDDVAVSKLNDRVAKKSHPGLYIGFADFDVRAHRFPRQPLVEPVASRGPKTAFIPLAPYQLTLEVVQPPVAPFGLNVKGASPSAPYGLFLTSTAHTRLQPGEIAQVVVVSGGKIIVRLDGIAGQMAFLNILGQQIKIGSTSSNNLIWDGFVFSRVGQSITTSIAGITFQVKYTGRGSQIFEITRLADENGNDVLADEYYEVSVYVPCDDENVSEIGNNNNNPIYTNSSNSSSQNNNQSSEESQSSEDQSSSNSNSSY